jgi:hypothetical protein
MKHHGGGGAAEFPGSTPEERNDCGIPIDPLSPKDKVDFGPFRNVDAESIKPAGWGCRHCRKPVRFISVVVPHLVERLNFHSCKCATICTWEAEQQPTAERWSRHVKLARKAGADLVIFNGNKPTPPEFPGLN